MDSQAQASTIANQKASTPAVLGDPEARPANAAKKNTPVTAEYPARARSPCAAYRRAKIRQAAISSKKPRGGQAHQTGQDECADLDPAEIAVAQQTCRVPARRRSRPW